MRLTPAEAAQLGIHVPPTAHKYRAQPQVIDGVRFASKAEGLHYGRLKLRERAGDIRNLELQPRYPLHAINIVTGELIVIGEYRADFCYVLCSTGALVVEDVKGMATLPLATWKIKHLKAEYGIEVMQIRK